jgi:hypothetical protein
MPTSEKKRIRAGTHDGRRLLQVHIDLDLWSRLETHRHNTALREHQRVTFQRIVVELLDESLAA